MANRNTTFEWWEKRRLEFELYISEFVLAEASQGHPEAAERRLSVLTDINELETPLEVRDLAFALIKKGSLPDKAELDALHIATATVNGMDYLLTWNCKHIANAIMRPKVEAVCRKYGYEPPIICTPQELMEG